MKLLSLLILLCFQLYAFTEYTPSWVTRSNVLLEDGDYFWIKGICEEPPEVGAYFCSETNAYLNLIELVYPNTELLSVTKQIDKLKSVDNKYKAKTRYKVLPLPYYKTRTYHYSLDGQIVVITDIAVKKEDFKYVKKTGKKISFDYRKMQRKLEFNTVSGNDQENENKSIVKYMNTLYWSPLRSDKVSFGSIGYEISLFKRWISLDVSYFDGSETENKPSIEKTTIDIKTNFELYFNFYHTETVEIGFGVGSMTFTDKIIEENDSQGSKITTENNKFKGSTFGLKLRSLASKSSIWGYNLKIQSLNLSSKDEDLSEALVTSGFFFVF